MASAAPADAAAAAVTVTGAVGLGRHPNEISPADGLRRFGQCGCRGRHRRWRSRTRPAPPFNLLSR